MRKHALLSASSSSRWLVCTPSAVLESELDEVKSSYADEGTLAHSLADVELKHKLKWITASEYADQIRIIYDDKLFNESMQDYVNDYVSFVLESYAEAGPGAQIFLETKLDISEFVPEGFGHVDVNIVNDKTLDVIDLKYGKGIPVSAEENKQMMLYGLGSYREFELSYNIEDVRMTIYQPRIDNYSSSTMSVRDLLYWAEKELKPKAKIAFEGGGDFIPGDHCRFCKAKPVCKANAQFHLEMAKHEFQKPELLTSVEISEILTKGDAFINWINTVEAYALDQALTKGIKWPGYKLVEGRSNRKYGDELKVISTLMKKGFTEEIIFVKKIAGITELSKRIGKPTFDSLVTPFLIKPPGSPALVPDEDKRPEYKSARNDFIE